MLTHFGHLRVTEILVHDHALDQLGVLQPPAHFAFYFDELEVNVSALHVGHSEDGVHGNLGHLSVTAVNPETHETNLSCSLNSDCNQSTTRDVVTHMTQHTATHRYCTKRMPPRPSLSTVLSRDSQPGMQGPPKGIITWDGKKIPSLFSLTITEIYYFLPL